MKSFLIALQFLTRIPVKFRDVPTAEETAKSLQAYPLIGLLIGCCLLTTYFLLSHVESLLQSALVLSVWVLVTGALHLDGLADSADALVGGFGDKNKTLAIMKDPYCGPVGVVTLLMVLLLKFSAIASLSSDNMLLLLCVPMVARVSILWSFLNIPCAKKEGLGHVFSECLSIKKTRFTLWFSTALIVIFLGWSGIVLLAGIGLLLFLLKKIMMQRIGGMTGDTLGAQIEITETFALIAVLLLI